MIQSVLEIGMNSIVELESVYEESARVNIPESDVFILVEVNGMYSHEADFGFILLNVTAGDEKGSVSGLYEEHYVLRRVISDLYFDGLSIRADGVACIATFEPVSKFIRSTIAAMDDTVAVVREVVTGTSDPAAKERFVGKATRSPKPMPLELLQEIVDDFNAKAPVGTPVRYWTTSVREGPGREGLTNSEAQIWNGAAAVVWVSTHPDSIPLSCIKISTVHP